MRGADGCVFRPASGARLGRAGAPAAGAHRLHRGQSPSKPHQDGPLSGAVGPRPGLCSAAEKIQASGLMLEDSFDI